MIATKTTIAIASPVIHRLARCFILPLWVAGALVASGCAPRVAGGDPLQALVDGQPGVSPGLPGLAAVVVDRTGEVRAEARGLAVIDPARAMTVDTPVRVASVSKVMTTLAVLRLVEEGRLDLDRDVSDYLGWRFRNPAHPDAPISLRLLLSHRSSLLDDGGYFFPLGATVQGSLSAKSWHAAPPGAVFSYTNLNFGVAATVMEKVTGERFDRLVGRLVTGPLKLDACFNWSGCSDAALARAGALYRKSADEEKWTPSPDWVVQVDDLKGKPPACLVRLPTPDAACDVASYRPGDNGTLFSPQGGLRISMRDLGRVARLLLNEGELDGVRLLKAETVRAMLTPVWRDGQGATGESYGGLMRCYGQSVQCMVGRGDQPVAGDPRWLGHMGDAYGLWSGLWIDPARGRGYVYAVTGTAANPADYPGKRSNFRAYEEALLDELIR
ncbi:serine hydrolase domain-containing protein [Sphingoaurantiacus capsulatus]|uniref:Serine hydrolase domain-containing protein n=1 Tax=Sphingoaurantiacus capsulatus TaxID=1771310 RepID=A0ABV7XG04_9SPHN